MQQLTYINNLQQKNMYSYNTLNLKNYLSNDFETNKY